MTDPIATRAERENLLSGFAPRMGRRDPNARSITLCEWHRDWDRVIWPHATAPFFKVKQQIPRLLNQSVMA